MALDELPHGALRVADLLGMDSRQWDREAMLRQGHDLMVSRSLAPACTVSGMTVSYMRGDCGRGRGRTRKGTQPARRRRGALRHASPQIRWYAQRCWCVPLSLAGLTTGLFTLATLGGGGGAARPLCAPGAARGQVVLQAHVQR